MESESFELEMKDALSGPAKDMKSAVDALSGSFGKLDKATKPLKASNSLGEATILKAINASKELGKTLEQKVVNDTKQAKESSFSLWGELTKLTGGLGNAAAAGGVAGLAFEGAKMGLSMFVDAAKLGVTILIDLTEKVVNLSISTGRLREKFTTIFEIYKNSTAEGQKSYAILQKLADSLPQSQEATFKSAQDLLTLGLQGQNRLHNTVQTLGQIQAVMGDEAAGKLKSIVTNAQQSTMGNRFLGMFAPTRQELVEIGVSQKDLAAQLSKQLGRTITEQDLLWNRVRISATQGIDALNKVIHDGRIGKAARDALLEPSVLGQHAHDVFSKLFDGSYEKAKPFLSSVRTLIDLFTGASTSGQLVKGAITSALDKFFEVARKVVVGVTTGFLKLELAAVNFRIAIDPAVKSLEQLGDNKTAIGIMATAFDQIKISLDLIVQSTAFFITQLGTVANLANKVDATLHGKSGGFGESLSQGLAQGAGNGKPTFGRVMRGIASFGLSEFADEAEIESPSKKMFRFGQQLMAGGQQGVDSMPDITMPAAVPSASDGGGSGGSRTITIDVGGIHIGGGGSVSETMALLEPAVADLFERLAIEVGGDAA